MREKLRKVRSLSFTCREREHYPYYPHFREVDKTKTVSELYRETYGSWPPL